MLLRVTKNNYRLQYLSEYKNGRNSVGFSVYFLDYVERGGHTQTSSVCEMKIQSVLDPTRPRFLWTAYRGRSQRWGRAESKVGGGAGGAREGARGRHRGTTNGSWLSHERYLPIDHDIKYIQQVNYDSAKE